MAKDINIHIKTPGAQQAKQQLEEVGRSSKQLGDKTAAGQKRGADETEKATRKMGGMGRVLGTLKTQVLSFVGAYAGLQGVRAIIAGITSAIRAQMQAVKEHAQIAAEQQKKLLALQTMGTIFEDRPELRKEVRATSELARRSFEETTEAYYTLESKGAGLTKEQKTGIMKEAAELSRAEPEADFKAIVDVFALYAKETRQQDMNQVQNVIRQTLSGAGATLGQMGKLLPRFLPAGIAGGLTGAETAGAWAFATTRAGGPEEGTMAIKNIFASLQGKGTPESKKLLQGLGITPEMNFFQQLSGLSAAQRKGKFGIPEAETIAGKEYYSTLLSMISEPKAMMETVSDVTRVARPDIDITKDKLRQIMTTDEFARREEEIRLLDVKTENIKAADIRNLRWEQAFKHYELKMREEGLPEWRIGAELKVARAIGVISPGLVDAPQQGDSTIINNYHNDTITNYNPIAGTNEDRGIGPRVGFD